jgi:uncharacterized protein (DUF924 family)
LNGANACYSASNSAGRHDVDQMTVVSADILQPADVTAFWREAGYKRWFGKDEAFDAEIRRRFEAAHMAAARGELAAWETTAEGALALLILLDQFPRNMFRGSAHAFATDPLALAIARRAVEAGLDQAVEPAVRVFFYLPFEHSERLEDQDRCVELCQALRAAAGPDAQGALDYAVIHRDIIARFGRFSHRNPAFGRTTTPEEQAFLDEGGFAG